MAASEKIKAKPIPKSITILGRRWFQKSFGNTYHKATVLVNGREVFTSDMQYGYGSQYEQTAIDWLIKEGYLPLSASVAYYSTMKENGIEFYSRVTDVTRERDL